MRLRRRADGGARSRVAAYYSHMKRKIVLAASVSLDGYLARRDGSIDFLVEPKGVDFRAFMARFDVCVMGRKTYEAGLKMGGEAMFKQGGAAYYVFSRTLRPGKRNYVTFVNEAIPSFIAAMRARPGKEIWHMGGGELAREFLGLDLIDEIHLGIVPTLIGDGLPLFPGSFPERKFALTKSETYGGTMVGLEYERIRDDSAATEKPQKAATKAKRKK
jgi:dihydrofolate reductase